MFPDRVSGLVSGGASPSQLHHWGGFFNVRVSSPSGEIKTRPGATWGRGPSLNVAIPDDGDPVHDVGMHSTGTSLRLIQSAQTVEALLFSPDSDPLALVSIPRDEALRLVTMPVMMGHRFTATLMAGGKVLVEPVEGEAVGSCGTMAGINPAPFTHFSSFPQFPTLRTVFPCIGLHGGFAETSINKGFSRISDGFESRHRHQ